MERKRDYANVKYIVVAVMLMACLSFGLAIAQEPPEDRAFAFSGDGNECTITFCQTDPRKTLVHVDGKLLPVRALTYTISDFTKTPTVECVMYEGAFAPTKPHVEVYSVREIRMVAVSEFQQFVDDGFEAGSINVATSAKEDPDSTPLIPDVTPLVPAESPQAATASPRASSSVPTGPGRP